MNPCHCAGSGECSGPWEVCDVLPEEYNLLAVSSATTLAEVRRLALWALDGVSLYLQCGADRELIESTKAYVDQTRHAIRKATPASALPPPNSDRLREQCEEAAYQPDHLFAHIAPRLQASATIEAIWPIIEVELDRLIEAYDEAVRIANVMAERVRKGDAEKAETSEVLEAFPSYAIGVTWWRMRGRPLLDKLKGES